MFRIIAALCIAGVTATSAFAQNSVKPPKLEPLTDLALLAHAKVVAIDDEVVVRFAFPKWKVTWKTETIEREVLVVKVEEKVVNGKKVEVKRQVPEKQLLESQIAVLNPNGMAKSDIPLAEVQAWDLTGKKLSSAELKARLKEPKPALPFDEVPEDGSSPLDPYYAAVFRPDLIVVHNEQLIEDIDASTPYPPAPEFNPEAPAPPGDSDVVPAPPPPAPPAAPKPEPKPEPLPARKPAPPTPPAP